MLCLPHSYPVKLVCHVHTQCTLRQVSTQVFGRHLFASKPLHLHCSEVQFDLKNMERLKEKLNALKNNAEAAEEREKESVEKFREFERIEEAKNEEKESLKRRICLLSSECARTEKQYSETKRKLDEFTRRAAEDNEARKALEEEDRVADEEIATLEQKVAEAKQYAAEMESKLTDEQRKFVATERELELSEQRLEINLRRVEDLEGDIEQCGKNLLQLEGKDMQAAERDEDYEEKVTFLENALNEAIQRYEELESKVGQQQRCADSLEFDIEHWQEKIEKVKAEYDNIVDLGND